MKKWIFIYCLLLLTSSIQSQNVIDLSGTWQFDIDRQDIGIQQKWFNRQLSDHINLPGSMPEKMKGDDVTVHTQWTGSLYDSSYYFNPYMEKFRKEGQVKLPFFLTPDKHYVGVAWYNKTINIPSAWKGKRILLYLERPHIESTVWVNGVKAGTQNSLCVAHEYDLTSWIKPGKCQISIRINNRLKDEYNVGQDSHSVTDQTQGNWNGIVGKIQLECMPLIHFKDIQIFPNIQKKSASVRIKAYGKGKAELHLSAVSFNSSKTHHVKPVKQIINLQGDNEFTIELPMGEQVQLWDEFHPTLYQLTAELTKGKEKTVQQVDFGMREIKIKGKWFYINGRKIMLRGTVENCDFPLTGYAPMDVKSWERVFRICRNYGLNHMRFHSYCPPEAAFIAADRVGFYLQPEGPSWPNHGVKLGMGHPIDQYLLDETIRLTRAYGNHPSFCMLACGNEPAGRWVDWVTHFVKYWENNDHRRVYTGASVGNSWQWQPQNQYHVKAGARGLNWNKIQPMTNDDYRLQNRIDTVKQPYVSHETGQWCAFPDFEEIRQYTGVNKAKNFEIFKDLLEEQGMGKQAHAFMMASGKLQALCYKYEIEKTLRTPDYAGFQLLSLNDYSGQGTALVGILNVFFKEKGYMDAQHWQRFCAPTVPLMRTDRFVYTNGDTLKASIEVAHFGETPLKDASIRIRLTDRYGKEYKKESIAHQDIAIGNQNVIGKIEFPLGDIEEATELNLEVSIDGTEAINDWNFWVYPQQVSINAGDVYITDSLNHEALDILEKGGKVLITAAGKIKYGQEVVQQFTPVFWNTSWFKMRPPHTTGILVNPNHPLFKEFPTDYHSNLQWWELLNKAQVMQFSDFPSEFQPEIQSIDTWFINRKIGMLFEANVLNGKLMMTSMDLDTDLNRRIVARQMRKAILDYMNSDQFRPAFKIEPQHISTLFTKVAGAVKSYTKDSPDELKPKLIR